MAWRRAGFRFVNLDGRSRPDGMGSAAARTPDVNPCRWMIFRNGDPVSGGVNHPETECWLLEYVRAIGLCSGHLSDSGQRAVLVRCPFLPVRVCRHFCPAAKEVAQRARFPQAVLEKMRIVHAWVQKSIAR